MDCRKAEEMLHAWIDGELDEAERTELTAHLSECAACAKKLAEYRHLDALLAQLDAQTKMPAGLFGRIMGAVDRESTPKKGRTYRWARWAASAAAILFLGVTAGLLWRGGVLNTPMGQLTKYNAAEEAAPQEAPKMLTDASADDVEASGGDLGRGYSAGEPAPAADENTYRGLAGIEVTWTPEETHAEAEAPSGIDIIDQYCEEHGLTVVDAGDEWISVQWQDEDQKQALLAFLDDLGEVTEQAGGEQQAAGEQVLLINVR
jgi:hypothetical protein